MSDKRETKDRFYWVEGVSRQQVRKPLDDWSGLHMSLLMSFLMCLVTLPSMVLAWQLPSEPQDEPA